MNAAGCLFIDPPLVLTGYNPKYQIWSGIGGKIISGDSLDSQDSPESPQKAAFRETIEELFGINPSTEILNVCTNEFVQPLIVRNNYGFIPLSFESFVDLSNILIVHKCISPLYDTIPNSVDELINNRKKAPNSEITELKIINYLTQSHEISDDLLLDCMTVKTVNTIT